MKKKSVIFIIIIFIMLSVGYEYNKQNVIRIEQLKYTSREELLQKSEGIDYSYIFKIFNLEPRSTYQFECWSEHYQNGQLINKLEILEQPQAFVTANKSSIGYIVLSLKEYSNSLQCTLIRDNNKNSVLISGYKKESFKFKGAITNLKEIKVSQSNEMLLLASGNGENSSFGIRIDQGRKLIEDDIKKNDEVYLIKCKLIKVH
ncbi:MAG: hypothetical protein ACI8WT_004526 [Clostridium sp.]|jgi:hypothetical protein